MLKTYDLEAVEYLAKLSEGGMRDALTLLDKCLAFSTDLTIDNVIKALGTVDYNTMIQLTEAIFENTRTAVEIIEDLYMDGKDLKNFTSQYVKFLIDVIKYKFRCDFEILSLPHTKTMVKWLNDDTYSIDDYIDLLNNLVKLKSQIKYSTMVKYEWEAMILLQEVQK